MRTGTIYGLCEPDGTLRYVGKTLQSPRARRGDAIREAVQRLRQSPVHDWIRDLVSDGTGPALWVLEEDVPVRDMDAREKAWVGACRSWGVDLLNVFVGGNGGKSLSKRKREKLSSFASRRPRDENGRFV